MNRRSSNPRVGHLLLSGAGDAARNMAIDQALLDQVDVTGTPVLRIYSWRDPTLSLGYFQRCADRQSHRLSGDLVCVRRATGGGAIVHHHELTYSIVMPIRSTDTQARLKLYRQMHDVFIRVFRRWGIRLRRYADVSGRLGDENAFLCFQRRTDDDLILSGYKVLGSAQRRTRHSVLQHGSLLIDASPYAPQLPGLVDLSSASLSVEEIAVEFVALTTSVTGISWRPADDDILASSNVDSIISDRFGNPSWLNRR